MIWAALLLLSPVVGLAQSSVDTSCLADPSASSPEPMLRDSTASEFSAIRQCIADQDGDCAEDALDTVDDDELNADELAVYWLATGDMEHLQGSSRRARRAYRRVIRQRDGNRQLALAAIERTAIRHIEDENFDDVVDALEDIQCGEWSPALVYLRARAHFGESEFAEAAAASQIAVDAQQAAGETVPAMWRSLVTASTTRAQQAETEEIVCTSERRSGSNIPVRVCTTRSQRDAEARRAREGFDVDLPVQVDTVN